MTSAAMLNNVSLFAMVDPSALEDLAKRFTRRMYHKGEVIFHQDDPGDRLYVVLSGLVRISITAFDGRESDIALLYEGDCFGEMSILDGELRSATASASEETETATLSRNDFLSFVRANSKVAIHIIEMLVKRLRAVDEFVGDMVFLDVPTRVAKRLLALAKAKSDETGDSGQVTVFVTHENLSKMVGASREVVSRALANYRKMGLLTTSNRRVIIKDISGLEKMASA